MQLLRHIGCAALLLAALVIAYLGTIAAIAVAAAGAGYAASRGWDAARNRRKDRHDQQ
ncbi:hypothetical protein [Streptomyces bohaiensis]|uniref:Uncharacterized protein n=1 Tax=Streptomyces bohaiensis TaxID=1431344 RepID=A0ABX1CAD4_9ACTN|nr:hypothetical protein [Streptomyces bohaiensis]NJQ14212.1 hypothetical protein [Streptomyces bohaiensis]